jgi:hypothetical protein
MSVDTVSFRTLGLIDPRCITTLGVSVKEKDNPIGYFGTGMKYAIAIILRNGGKISVWRGEQKIVFSAKTVSIRGANAEIVCMDDAELGFTTQLGKNWEVWQAFRELYCNTLDESGEILSGSVDADEAHTTVVVQLEAFAQCLRDKHKYILQPALIYAGKTAEFHSGGSDAIFYRSIRVMKNYSDKPNKYTINILDHVALTEDRTVQSSGSVFIAIAQSVLKSENADFIEAFITVGRLYAEFELDLDWSHIIPSETFLSVARRVAADSSRPINRSVIEVLTRHKEKPDLIEAELLPSEDSAMQRAIEFCKALKYTVDDYPILIVESLGESVLGQANIETRQIHIAKRAIQLGDLNLAATLIEEWAHIKHNLKDCDRGMQNWLFEQVTRLGDAYLHCARGCGPDASGFEAKVKDEL